MHPLTILSFFLTSLIFSTLGSPLKFQRRQVVETLTVTNTVTTSITASISVPFAPIFPTAVPTDTNLPLSGVTAIPANASAPEPVTTSPVLSTPAAVGIFPTAVPTTLSTLPLFPPTVPSPTTTFSSSTTTIPIFPTAVPTAKSPEDTARCAEYCKQIDWDPAACQSNCHIINGQIQLDAPGVLIFPPTAPYPSSTISSTSTSTRTTTTTSPSSTPSSAPLVLGPFSSGASQPGRGQMKAIPLTAEAKAKGIINAVARNCQVKCLGKPGYAACVSQCELEKFLPRPGRVML